MASTNRYYQLVQQPTNPDAWDIFVGHEPTGDRVFIDTKYYEPAIQYIKEQCAELNGWAHVDTRYSSSPDKRNIKRYPPQSLYYL